MTVTGWSRLTVTEWQVYGECSGSLMSHMSWRTVVIYYLAVRWISLRPKPHLPANNQHFMKSEEDTDSSLTRWQPSTLRVALEHSHALEEHITRSQQSWAQLLKALDSTGTGLKAIHD